MSLKSANALTLKWSSLNRLSCFFAGTDDARGYRQWQGVGRYVRKGSTAIHIFAPLVKKVQEGTAEESEERLVGFRLVPVFRVEDTDGEPLDYQNQIRSLDPANLPLVALAEELGIRVRVEITAKAEYGSFSPSAKEIRLCTDSEQTFVHELSHAIDHGLGSYEDYETGEVVAELSACFLASLYGLKADIGYRQKYIRSWSKGTHVAWMIGKALDGVRAIYSFIETWEHQHLSTERDSFAFAKDNLSERETLHG
jgi:antirestriction protein ArdC